MSNSLRLQLFFFILQEIKRQGADDQISFLNQTISFYGLYKKKTFYYY